MREIWGGDSDCKHPWKSVIKHRTAGGPQVPQSKWKNNQAVSDGQRDKKSNFCSKCNAWRGQLGLEPTFQLYLDHLMIVCAEIKRVLKKTGSFWLNMGDTYGGTNTAVSYARQVKGPKSILTDKSINAMAKVGHCRGQYDKCLLGIPSRLRNRLVDEQGWICRNTVIWSKPNSMPSSVKDRLSNSYEFLFHFVKNTKPQYYWNEKTALMVDKKPKELKEGIDWEWRKCPKCEGTGKYENKVCSRCKGTGKIKYSFWHSLGYWYDLDAIREPHKGTGGGPGFGANALQQNRSYAQREHPAGKNPGDVWTIPTQPRPEAHFATFPDKLCIKPILATCPAEICKKCGKAKVRITKYLESTLKNAKRNVGGRANGYSQGQHKQGAIQETIGWTDCGCNAGWVSGIILDPFAGRGTVLIMAKKLGRHYVGYELKGEYCKNLIEPALEAIDPLFKNLH